MDEEFPVHKEVEVIKGETIYKTQKWWCAALLIRSFGREKLAFYLWQNREGKWRRKQKFTIDIGDWDRIKAVIDDLMKGT